jgi:hypothetical protein
MFARETDMSLITVDTTTMERFRSCIATLAVKESTRRRYRRAAERHGNSLDPMTADPRGSRRGISTHSTTHICDAR